MWQGDRVNRGNSRPETTEVIHQTARPLSPGRVRLLLLVALLSQSLLAFVCSHLMSLAFLAAWH